MLRFFWGSLGTLRTAILLLSVPTWSLSSSLSEDILKTKYDYHARLNTAEIFVGQSITLDCHVQKSPYNVSGKPIRVDVKPPSHSDKPDLVFEGITDSNGLFSVTFAASDMEGTFMVHVSFLNPRHMYREHVHFLSYRVLDRRVFYVQGGLCLMFALGLLFCGLFWRSSVSLWLLNPLLTKRSPQNASTHYNALHDGLFLGQLSAWTAGLGLMAHYLIKTHELTLLAILGFLFSLFRLGTLERTVSACLWLVFLIYIWWGRYGETAFFHETWLRPLSLWGLLGSVLIFPSPLLWTPMCILLLNTSLDVSVWIWGGLWLYTVSVYVLAFLYGHRMKTRLWRVFQISLGWLRKYRHS